MTSLIIGFFCLVTVSCVLVFSPLFKRPGGNVNRDAVNKQIFRERVSELEGAADELGEAAYVSGLTTELEKSLVSDVSSASEVVSVDNERRSGFSTWLLSGSLLLLPALAIWLYTATGNYQAVTEWEALKAEVTGQGAGYLNPSDREAQARLQTKTVSQVVTVLQASLQQDNETVEGWRMLATTFAQTENLESAVYAIKRGLDIDSKDVDSLLVYGQLLIAVNGGALTPESKNILDQVFLQQPNNATALSLLGMAYYNAHAYPAAIANWQRLLVIVAGNEKMKAVVQRSILAAQERMGQAGLSPQSQVKQPAMAAKEGVSDTDMVSAAALDLLVDVASDLKGLLSPSDTLFVFAKAVTGPPMPLAVFRSTLGEFPVKVHLDDSMAMMPQLKMSKFEQVNVVARISKHGSVSARPGDLEGRIERVKLADGGEALELVIDRVLR
ncbi:MAG: c-type cytochrome biogenesis protein CcmI [Gammaproteobacteria bacterium]|nr:MAG: c-type cytochrome biogenesis protein CcmI [Gammaproteobacteria bacterium]